ncbi:thiamine pyrophosphate-binding protein [Candidatus Thioglobus sp.]|nr:thiamine pyrophosphate-binding protein [Candidatus Thioglobus sp.]
MKKRVADIVASFLIEKGIKDIFTVTGGGAMFLNDGIASNNNINYICNHHEQACAMGAVGYAKYKNGLAAVMVTSGCGATNSITGLLDAWGDNTSVIFISGQIKRKETSRNSKTNLRQFGVQEADIVSIVDSITKYSVMINNPEDILYHLEKAIHIALNGRPGPVWIDIPLDVQGFSLDENSLRHYLPDKGLSYEINGIDKFVELYNQSQRPIILAGNGIRLSGSIDNFREFLREKNLPCVVSYLGVDFLEQDNPNYVGRVGIKGDRAGNFAIQNSDLIICLGTRLSITQTGFEYELFGRNSKLIVVDIDSDEHQKDTVKIDQFICADIGIFLEKTVGRIAPKPNLIWQKQCIYWKNKWPVYQGKYDEETVNMYEFGNILSKVIDEEAIIVSDAGSNFYVMAQSLIIKSVNQRYITSGAQGDMGFTLPAAIGACLASKKPVIGITGDGSFQMNIQELQTVKYYNLPVKTIIMNNGGYLSIRGTQNKFFNGRRIGTDKDSGVSFPNIEKIAIAYEIPYIKINNANELMDKLKKVINQNGPVICEVMCPEDQEVLPTVSAVKNEDGSMTSKPIEDMYPYLERDEFYEEMINKPI